jgi:hypothetical protein
VRSRDEAKRERPLGLVLLGAVGILLAIRAQGAVHAVLETQSQLQHATSPAPQAERSLVARLTEKDALLVSVSDLMDARNPFLFPSSARPAPARVAEPAATPSAPSVRLLLYDHTNPIVVLSSGSQTSERLQQGDRFQGWEVVSIQPGSVTISRNGETLVLTSP